MPSPWLVLLKNVPWIEVIRNATTVADGARKLWNSVRRQPTPAERSGLTPLPLAEASDLGGVNARLAALDSGLAELREEMLASSELIKSLAEQNALLVARLDALRIRTLWLTAALAVVGIIAAVALALRLFR